MKKVAKTSKESQRDLFGNVKVKRYSKSSPRLIDLFAGIGGIRMGFELEWTDLIFSTTLEERIFDNLHPKGVLNMAKGQRLKPEQIVTLLRQIDVLTTNGKTLAQACKEVGTVEQSYYRWRKIYGGMKIDQARKYKDLELENTRLKKLVADLSLREVMLKEVIKGNF